MFMATGSPLFVLPCGHRPQRGLHDPWGPRRAWWRRETPKAGGMGVRSGRRHSPANPGLTPE